MDIQISTRHGHLRNSDKEQIEAKVEKKLTHIFPRIEEIEVVVSWDREEHHLVSEVEILVNCEHKHDFVAKAHGESMELMPAFEDALHKMEAQLRKYKSKAQDHHKK